MVTTRIIYKCIWMAYIFIKIINPMARLGFERYELLPDFGFRKSNVL